jgi:hypothetical protein
MNRYRRLILEISTALIIFSCQNENKNKINNQENSDSIINTNSTVNKFSIEDFDDFLNKFCDDTKFQIERTTFPFPDISILEESNNDTLKDYIQKNQWQHLALIMEEKYLVQKYDNFNCKLRNTDERVLAYEGIDNSIGNYYYFKRIDGLWYLIKRVSYT